ncbi:TIR domain-containing protein [Streptomyces sp. STR69]|uniref:TIR domain-containing protein n=1 Tax=Streptomyces sp. STR69 TaxID=1796942 RepID=UPI0021C5E75B|nr:TIR domain-containing protein [Streptomyces sp. STR69]
MSPQRRSPRQLPSITNLPPPAAPFVGRDEEVEQAHELLADHGAVLVHDPKDRPHGYGTSQLAITYGHRYTRHYEVMWMFDCGGERDPARLADRLEQESRRLREEYERTRGEPLAGPTAANWLYFYNNVVQPDEVRRHFPEGNARILVTSRATGTWDTRARLCVGPLTRAGSIELIQAVTALDQTQADRLADVFDGHPGQIVRAGQAIRGGIITAEQFVTLTEIARMAPAPAEAASRSPGIPGQLRAEVSDSDRTSLWTNLLRSAVCWNSGSYQRWIEALRERTGILLDDEVTTGLSMEDRVDLLLDLAFEQERPDFLRAIAETVTMETKRAGSGRDPANNVSRIVEELVRGWQGVPQTPSVTAATGTATCFFFTSWFNREVYAKEVLRFHNLLQQQVEVRRGERELSDGFLDRNTRRGAQWEPRLIEAIRTTRVLVPLITKDYFTSPWCRREWAVMMRRIESADADLGREPVAIMPVFWVRPERWWTLPKDFERFQHRAPGEYQGDVFELMASHREDELMEYVSELARSMVDEGGVHLPHLAQDLVMDLPLAFPDADDGVR